MHPPGVHRWRGALEAFDGPVEEQVGAQRYVLLENPARVRVNDHCSIGSVDVEVAVLAEAHAGDPAEEIVLQQIHGPNQHRGQFSPLVEDRSGKHYDGVAVLLGGDKRGGNLRLPLATVSEK